jgi:hypothetical protein
MHTRFKLSPEALFHAAQFPVDFANGVFNALGFVVNGQQNFYIRVWNFCSISSLCVDMFNLL